MLASQNSMSLQSLHFTSSIETGFTLCIIGLFKDRSQQLSEYSDDATTHTQSTHQHSFPSRQPSMTTCLSTFGPYWFAYSGFFIPSHLSFCEWILSTFQIHPCCSIYQFSLFTAVDYSTLCTYHLFPPSFSVNGPGVVSALAIMNKEQK